MNPESIDMGKIRNVLGKGLTEEVFPGAVLLVSKDGVPVFLEAVGHLSLTPERSAMSKDTIFDLASLTKPLGTTLAIMHLVDKGAIGLDQPLSELISEMQLGDKGGLTPRLLLNHSAGLKDWKPFFLDIIKFEMERRKSLLRSSVIEEPFAYKVGSESVYSDLGFILLEWVVEETANMVMPDYLERYFYQSLSLKKTFFIRGNRISFPLKEEIAATEDCPWRKEILQGIVHDDNAFAAGGFAGHAGLFSNASDIFLICNMLMGHYRGDRSDYLRSEIVQEFFKKQQIAQGSTWALGWDTPSVGDSSSGKHFSRNSVGHLGFSGTSVWIDLDKDVTVIFLTNRVHPTRNNNKIRAFRPRLHDAVMESLNVPCDAKKSG